ncbi:hypothetical protein GQ457_01G012500 [Hibiscus cannabinus]
MASTSTCFSMEEGQSISKPPFFNGANYPYWKNRMMLFIQSTDYTIWDVQRHEWNDEERRRVQMNAKAMHILFCAFGPNEYAKMSSCSSAKEIWDKLEVTHEGTSEVKETKIGLLNLSYENFKMEPDEDIKKMFDRFSVIVNGLKGYGEIIPEDKLVRKLICSLPEIIFNALGLQVLDFDLIFAFPLKHTSFRDIGEYSDAFYPFMLNSSFGRGWKNLGRHSALMLSGPLRSELLQYNSTILLDLNLPG